MTEKSPNVPKCKSHLVDGVIICCCCGANECLIRVHLFCYFLVTSFFCFCLFIVTVSVLRNAFLWLKKRDIFELWQNHPWQFKKNLTPITHIKHGSFIKMHSNRILKNHSKIYETQGVCFYFHKKNHHSCVWHTRIWIASKYSLRISFFQLFRLFCFWRIRQMKYVRAMFISHIRWTRSSNYEKNINRVYMKFHIVTAFVRENRTYIRICIQYSTVHTRCR